MLVLVGLNHRSAPLTVREQLGFSEAELPSALVRLKALEPIEEAMILSTCNRVEILARAKDRSGGGAAIKDFLSRERNMSLDDIGRFVYQHDQADAVRHLFQVASGLDSMVLGEPQILGQVKRAYLAAREAGTTGTILERLLQQGLAAAKRVRSETGISRHAVSIAFAAVELARKIFGDLRGHAALLLGAGKMTELAARHLIAEGVRDVIVSNRTYSRAVALAERLGGRAVNWDDGFGCLASADIVVTGTAAPEPVLRKQTVQGYLRARRNRPLFLIDIAVPRDVEPSVNDLDNVYLYDIDDLQGVVDSNLEERKRQAATARQMVDGEVDAFMRWRQSLDVSPTITALRNTLHGLSRKELERFRRKLGAINPEQEQALNDLLHAVVQKILHPTIVHLKKNAARGEGGDWAGLYREIFAIPDAEFETRDAGDTTPVPRTAGGED